MLCSPSEIPEVPPVFSSVPVKEEMSGRMLSLLVTMVASTAVSAVAQSPLDGTHRHTLGVRIGWVVLSPTELNEIIRQYSSTIESDEIPGLERADGSTVITLRYAYQLFYFLGIDFTFDIMKWDTSTSGVSALQRIESRYELETFSPALGVIYTGLLGERGGASVGVRGGPTFYYLNFQSYLTGGGFSQSQENDYEDVELSMAFDATISFRVTSFAILDLVAGYHLRESGFLAGTATKDGVVEESTLVTAEGRKARIDLSGPYLGAGIAVPF